MKLGSFIAGMIAAVAIEYYLVSIGQMEVTYQGKPFFSTPNKNAEESIREENIGINRFSFAEKDDAE